MNVKQAKDFAIAVVGIVFITHLVLPGRQSAKMLDAMNQSFSGMMRTIVAVQQRDPSIAETVLAMGSEEQFALFESLLPQDMEWLNTILADTVTGE